MRVSTNQVYNQSVNRMQELQQSTYRLQDQVSSGLRINQPADDPVGAATLVQLDGQRNALEQYTRNGVLAEQRLTQVDDVMNGVTNALQRTYELLIQGRSEALAASDRVAIATEIREQLDVLVDLGNTRNASGDFIFAGAKVETRPFSRDAAAEVSYNGNQTVRRLEVSETRSIEETFSGDEAFMRIRNGNGTFVTAQGAANAGTLQVGDNGVVDATSYVAHDYRIVFSDPATYDVIDDTTGATVLAAQSYIAGDNVNFGGLSLNLFGEAVGGDEILVTPSANQSMFDTVRNIALALERGYDDAESRARFGFDMDRSIEGLNRSIDRVSELRAVAGSRINAIEVQRTANEDFGLNLETLRSEIADVDFTAVISDLARESTALEAAQSAFVRVQQLSLFNYL
jgi:flagellar hook-associated protein 3 FlgL